MDSISLNTIMKHIAPETINEYRRRQMDCFTTFLHLSQQLELDPSHLVLLCGRVFGNKACLIRKAKKKVSKTFKWGGKCNASAQASLMGVHWLWYECRIYVAIYVCCVTAEGAWPCSITRVNTSAEITWDLPDVFPSPRLLSLSLLLLCSGVCWMPDFSLTRWSHYPWQFKSDRHWQVKDYQTMQCRKALH